MSEEDVIYCNKALNLVRDFRRQIHDLAGQHPSAVYTRPTTITEILSGKNSRLLNYITNVDIKLDAIDIDLEGAEDEIRVSCQDIADLE